LPRRVWAELAETVHFSAASQNPDLCRPPTPEKVGADADSEDPGRAPYHDCRRVSHPVSFIK
jgi:hypothetical protein